MKRSQYFADAAEEINQNYLSADGWEGADDEFENADDWDYAFGDELEADAGSAPNRKSAMNSGASQPYTVILQNTTTTDISNVIILDAAARFANFAVSGVSFSYEPTVITYGQFLGSIVSGKVFRCNQMRLIASNVSSSVVEQQVLTSVDIETKDPNGNLVRMSFIPEYDSYQFRANQTDVWYNFNVDALTKITVSTLYASTTLKIRLFPGVKLNQFKQLRGGAGSAVSRYKSPNVNKALKK